MCICIFIFFLHTYAHEEKYIYRFFVAETIERDDGGATKEPDAILVVFVKINRRRRYHVSPIVVPALSVCIGMHRIYPVSAESNNASYVTLPVSNLTIACKSPLNFKHAVIRLSADHTVHTPG